MKRTMDQEQLKRLWFVVFDSEGKPFNGTRVSSIDCPYNTDVERLRHLVQKELDYPGLLRDVAPTLLKVFRDKRCFGFQYKWEEEPELELSEYGMSSRDPVILIAPRSAPIMSSLAVAQYSLSNILEAFKRDLIIKFPSSSPQDCFPSDSLLFWKLDTALTNVNFNGDLQEIKLLIAVSGAGKTRSIMEFLFKNHGYYFLASPNGGYGSSDMRKCIPKDMNDAYGKYAALAFSRKYICSLVMERGFTEPWQILFCQLYPEKVFKYDAFSVLNEKIIGLSPLPQISGIVFDYAFIDEIQVTLDPQTKMYQMPDSNSARPLFSFIINSLRPNFTRFILSGTGIDHVILREALGSSTAKNENIFRHKLLSPFTPMNSDQIAQYVKFAFNGQFVNGLGLLSPDIIEFISKVFSKSSLFYGRPRFTASTIERIILNADSEKDANTLVVKVITKFSEKIHDPFSDGYPLRFLTRALLLKQVNTDDGTKKLEDVLQEACINCLLQSKSVITFQLSNDPEDCSALENAAELIKAGIGFLSGAGNKITLLEPVVWQNIIQRISPQKILYELLIQLEKASPRACVVGFWFDYIVAISIIAHSFSNWKDRRIVIYRGSLSKYLAEIENDQTKGDIVVCFPLDQIGPDLVLKIGKRVISVQVKFLKNPAGSIILSTTDPAKLCLCRTTPHDILKGWESERNQILSAIDKHQLNVERLAVMHHEIQYNQDLPGYDGLAQIVTQKTAPLFFNSVSTTVDIWKIMDEVWLDIEQSKSEYDD